MQQLIGGKVRIITVHIVRPTASVPLLPAIKPPRMLIWQLRVALIIAIVNVLLLVQTFR